MDASTPVPDAHPAPRTGRISAPTVAQVDVLRADDAPPPRPFPAAAALGVFALAWTLQAAAIWSVHYPPPIDLPNHMARHWLEAQALRGEPLPAGYALDFRVRPNLGADLVVPPLIALGLSPVAAAKAFLSLAVFLYWLGPTLLIRQVAGDRPAAWLASLLLLPWDFNHSFFWGFLNFYSGVGLALAVFSHYLALSRRGRVGAGPLALHAGLVALLFLWHLAAWGAYGVLFAFHRAARLLADGPRRGWRPALGRAAFWVVPTLGSVALFGVYHFSKDAVTGGRIDYGPLDVRLAGALSVFRGYSVAADALTGLLWLGAVAAGFRLGWRVWRPTWLHLAVPGLALLYAVLPVEIGTTYDAASRVIPTLLACSVAFLATLRLRRPGLALALLTACVVVRFGVINATWAKMSDELDRTHAAFALFQPGDRVATVSLTRGGRKEYAGTHFDCWLVPERGVFLSSLFHDPGQQPLRFTDFEGKLYQRFDGVNVVFPEKLRQFDYLWVYNPADAPVRLPEWAKEIYSAGDTRVYRLDRQ